MPKNILFLILLFLAVTFTASNIRIKFAITSYSLTLYVPDDYKTIQEAINAAEAGDTIIVEPGNYTENVLVNKTVSLIGRERDKTIIDGGYSLSVFRVISNNVKIMNFTIQNSWGTSDIYSGIFLSRVVNATICNNTMRNNIVGVNLRGGTNSTLIKDNLILNNSVAGIIFAEGSNFNYVISNDIMNNTIGVKITSCSFNTLYRNNFINNSDYPAHVFSGTSNKFDNGAEGNFWSDYRGNDTNGDGIGDTDDLPWWGIDFKPLMEPWNMTRIHYVNSYEVKTYCNYTVASFSFDQTRKQISFYITGPAGWKGFCDTTVPQALLNPNQTSYEKWIVLLGSNPPINVSIVSVDNSTLISLNFTLSTDLLYNRVRLSVGVFYPPTADFYYVPTEATVIAPVAFYDNSSSRNGMIISRKWFFGDQNVTVNNSTSVTYRFSSKGIFNVSLTVRDDKNGSDSITRFVTVSNLNPTANFRFSPSQPKVGEDVYFFGNISKDADGNITQWLWNFDDGTSFSETNVVHNFQHVRDYNVTLTVRDDNNSSNSTSKVITVQKGTTNIEINAPATTKAGRNFNLTATLKDCANRPIKEELVVFYINGETIGGEITNDEGKATVSANRSIVGTYEVKVQYMGGTDYFGCNASANITFEPLNTTLTLSAPNKAIQNEAVTLYAILRDEYENAVKSATVEFYLYNGSSWKKIGYRVTNQSGVASLSFTTEAIGSFKLKGVFNGETIYATSSSQEVSFKVYEKGFDYMPYIILAIVIIIVACVFIIFRKRRK